VPVLVLALLGALSACSGDDPEPTTDPGLPSQAALKSYFAAITSGDADDAAKARSDVAAEGSPAAGYAAFVGASDEAVSASGQDAEADADPVDVEEVDGGFKACVAGGQCVTWTELKGEDGRLVDFTISGVPLSESLVDLTAQAPIESPGLYRVQPGWAYQLPSGVLDVVVTVTASDIPLSPKPGTYIESDKILKGSDDFPHPTTIEAGTSSPVVLTFPDSKGVKLDGQITFELRLGDQGTESIGFGLADPAAS